MSQGIRLKELLKVLDIKNKDFAVKISKTPNYISMLITNTKKINGKFLLNITKVYPDVNIKWLEFGEGEMFLNKTNNNTVEEYPLEYKKPEISEHKGVPYYDVDFIGGFDLVLNEQSIIPKFYIDFKPFNDADFWVNITGKSMSPFISHGDIVALKKINSWKDFILFGEIYALVTDEFRTVKIVGKGKDNKHLRLIPYNKSIEFSEQQIPKRLINHLFRVKGSIKKFF